MKNLGKIVLLVASACLLFFATGCASTASGDSSSSRVTKIPADSAEPAKPAVDPVDYGPSAVTFEKDGVLYTKGSMAFPTGLKSSSGLLLEKVVPAEVMVGTPFSYWYKVKNLTGNPIYKVRVTDRVSDAFDIASSDPKPLESSSGVAVWEFEYLQANEEKTIMVQGVSNREGSVTTCGLATYSPILCESINVVKADLELVKTAPSTVTVCDQITLKYVVRNSGSSALSGVVIKDPLASGLTTTDGATSVSIDVGSLGKGESKEYSVVVIPSGTGNFASAAKASSRQGVEAQDKAGTKVTSPVLSIVCDAPSERFAGRPVPVCLTVSNTGDSVSTGTIVSTTVPAGVVFQGATAGGVLQGDQVVWNVGSLPAGDSKEVCATFTLATPGQINLQSVAKGDCAKAVATSCGTRVAGIPAILLEVIDLEDPIEVGNNETYEIVVTNQGSAPATNVKIVCELEDTQSYISVSGATSASTSGKTITLGTVPSIAPKATVTWQVVVKAEKAGDVRFSVKLTSDQISRPVSETESTNQY